MARLDFPADARESDAPGAPAEAPRAEDAPGGRLSVRRLTLTDFRCYRHQRLEVDESPVVLTGPNGAGKTNLLEGLSFLVPGRGLRRARLADVARHESGAAPGAPRPWGVAATVRTPTGEVEIGTGYEKPPEGKRDKRSVRVNGEGVKTQAVLAEHLSAHWLTPQMDRLFIEGPSTRRRFLDRLAFDSDPAHAGRVKAYDHAMRERMRLLRGGDADPAWLAALEDTMATKGVAVAAARVDMAGRLGRQLASESGAFPRAAVEVAGTVETWLSEGPALAAEDRLRETLEAERGRDRAEGRAATGPHKSDMKVMHLGNGRPAELCSTGEQKALLVALVLATVRLRTREKGWSPLLLLDEIVAHLDETRRRALLDEIPALGQVWLTGTDAALFEPLGSRAQFFRVADAEITPVA